MAAPRFTVDPWMLREDPVDVDALAVSETVLSLPNGFLGIRGSLDEASPSSSRGTFLAGVHETHPLAYPEGGYGLPEEGQAIVSAADGMSIRVTVDGDPLDVRTADVEHHSRTLDLRGGTLDRTLRWRSPAGARLELTTRRLVSLARRSVVVIRWQLCCLEGSARITVRSELTVGVAPPAISADDPRVAEALDKPFEALALKRTAAGGALSQRTCRTGIGLGAAVAHDLHEGCPATIDTVVEDHWCRDEDGPYIALALDGTKQRVDGVASNMGHLLGTGLLDAEQERIVVDRLVDPTMFTGYGVRTLSSDNGAYWPLRYHGGSVWTHDTAYILRGMLRAGFKAEAAVLARGLLRAASGFEDRLPELFSGEDATTAVRPMPYPASCRPQAWAAASAVPVAQALRGL
ncbi:MGH1-like glycoside hydrolase domain-containing protein [Brachybacterium muris]|uniref:MGH1-like glycoside hydrolase domain-containing protein n=1 Tax=Brachybacterium muris TaxID=219301 RepID=UPI00223B1C6D|nr:hypothetical protein [Brachybacterium muris]